MGEEINMRSYAIDKLKILFGENYYASQHIKVFQPKIQEIVDYGEEAYFSLVGRLTCSPYDMLGWLQEHGMDYETISDFELFIMLFQQLPPEDTCILFGRLDFRKFSLYKRNDSDELFLHQNTREGEVVIDRLVYERIASFIRFVHGYKKNTKKAANLFTKRKIYQEYLYTKNDKQDFHSILHPLISSMVNSSGFKYNHEEVLHMPLYKFMNSVKRISKIKSVEALQMSMTTYGFDYNSINPKKDLDWAGELGED